MRPLATLLAMSSKGKPANRQQLGIRVDGDLVVEAKVLAARQRRRLNEVVEEALRDLLKKYREKRKGYVSRERKGMLPRGK